MENLKTITIRDMFSLLLRRLKWIIAITLICVIAAVIITSVFITPQYTASASLLVSSYVNRSSSDISYSEINASQMLVNTYIVVLRGNYALSAVAEELGGEYTGAQLAGMISASAVNNTQILRISVTHPDPTVAAKVANAVVKVAPSVIESKTFVGEVSVIDNAVVPSSPSSPNMMQNVIRAFFFGFAVSYLAFLMYEVFDTVIRNEDDVVNAFDIPVLGVIPSLDETESVSYPYGGAAK